jgi:hypothetical protein
VFLSMILWKYVESRRQFQHWSVGYGRDTDSSNSITTSSVVPKKQQTLGIYDRWLVIRFTIAFLALG